MRVGIAGKQGMLRTLQASAVINDVSESLNATFLHGYGRYDSHPLLNSLSTPDD